MAPFATSPLFGGTKPMYSVHLKMTMGFLGVLHEQNQNMMTGLSGGVNVMQGCAKTIGKPSYLNFPLVKMSGSTCYFT